MTHCPHCGITLAPNAPFCHGCGAQVGTADVNVLTAVAPETKAATAEMVGRACPYCRFPIKDGGEVTECAVCHAVHHSDCFADNHGCAISGCAGANAPTPDELLAQTATASPQPTMVMGEPVPPPQPTVPAAYAPVPAATTKPMEPRRSGWVKPALIAVGITVVAAGAAVGALLVSRQQPGETTTIVRKTVPARPKAHSHPLIRASKPPTASPTSTPAPTPTTSVEDTPTTPTETPPPAPSGPGPAQVMREHLSDLAAGDYNGAFSLFTPAYRSGQVNWVGQHEQASPVVEIDSVGAPVKTSPTTAYVPVSFHAHDTVDTPGSDTQCRAFSGNAQMEKVDGVWRYTGQGLSGSLSSGC